MGSARHNQGVQPLIDAVVNGSVHCWGDNDSGQLGDGSTTPHTRPVAVTGVANATAVEVTKFTNFLNNLMITSSNAMSVTTQAKGCCGVGGTTILTAP